MQQRFPAGNKLGMLWYIVGVLTPRPPGHPREIILSDTVDNLNEFMSFYYIAKKQQGGLAESHA